MNYAFDLTQNIAKQIFTLVAASPTFVYVVRCVVSFLPCWILHCDLWTCSLAGWKGLVFMTFLQFKVHYQKSQSKMLWVILCAYLLIAFLQKLKYVIRIVWNETLHTVLCHIFMNKCIFSYILYIKLSFFQKFYQSHFWSDFHKIFTIKIQI